MSRSFFEPLETRQLMSASLKNGVLAIEGNDLANVIAVSQDSTNVRVNEDGKVTAFRATSVKSIVVNGGGGNDQLLGRTNLKKPMTLRGGAGNDTLVGGAMGDVFEGGPGEDRADYSHRNQNMNISLDDLANDGATNDAGAVVEKDNVKSDVEVIRTGNGNDLIRGSNADNIIGAGFGLDTVYGMGGHDLLAVASRNHYDPDTVYGGEGNDWIETTGVARLTAYGENGNDKIVGGSANDTLSGGTGTDSIYGNDGADDISGGDWRDHLFGGRGNDIIRGGAGDDIIEAGDGDDTVWGNVPPLSKIILGTKIGGGILGGPITGSILITPPSDSDVISGGAGNDLLHGGDDADTLSGGAGNDKLWGDAGNDVTRGNAGNDSCYGGDGADNLSGDEGDDLIVSIGGGAFDTLFGGTGSDNFWADAEDSEQVRDADFGEALFGGVKRVARFMNNVTRNLNGQNLPDPDGRYRGRGFTLISPAWNNFKDTPFVGAGGISEADVQQGQTGDCWMLAAVAAAAKFSKIRLTHSMVDLGDGTYAFKFINPAGEHQFVRVDADLPVWSAGSTLPRNAGFGTSNVSWVAMLEKAFAVFHGGNRYLGLHGTSPVKAAFAAFGMRDAGNLFVKGDGSQTLQNIQDAMKQGKVVTLSTPNKAVPAGANVIKDHAYVVESINTFKVFTGGTKIGGGVIGGLGKAVDIIYSVTLRNPWGTDGAGNDGNNNGLITVRLQDVAKYFNEAQAAWA
jgi:Ca2+-binding RTX toxin-like protein